MELDASTPLILMYEGSDLGSVEGPVPSVEELVFDQHLKYLQVPDLC